MLTRRVYKFTIRNIRIKILIEERSTAHRKHWNKGIHQQIFNVGDVIKAHIQVKSKIETGKLKKLSYQSL